MHDEALVRAGKDDPSAIGYVLAATVALATLAWWVSRLTAGSEHGGRYDVPIVNSVTWFAFLLFAAVATISMIGGVLRIAESLRPLPGRAATSTASPRTRSGPRAG